ncbi:MAG: hypothetical protein Kow0069_06620 [Promethearchaeota archaeon]
MTRQVLARVVEADRLDGNEDFARVSPDETNSRWPLYVEKALQPQFQGDVVVDVVGFYPFVQLRVRPATW